MPSLAEAQTPEPPLQRHRLSIADYYRMGTAGILGEDDRVELIEGEIIDMAPIGSAHAGTVTRLAGLFTRAVGDAAIVSVQNPLRLDRFSEPQPDVALLRPREDFYSCSHPKAQDTFLVVQVAETSLAYDLDIKVPLYARHAIPEVWVLDLAGRRLHVFRRPVDGTYAEAEAIDRPAVLAPTEIALAAIDFSGVL